MFGIALQVCKIDHLHLKTNAFKQRCLLTNDLIFTAFVKPDNG